MDEINQREMINTSEEGKREKAKVWFDRIFKGCSGDTLPVKDGSGNEGGYASKRLSGVTDFASVKKYCKEHSVSENAFFSAAFGIALCSYTASEQAIFITACDVSGETRTEVCKTISGKTVPVCFSYDDKLSVEEFVKGCDSFLTGALENEIYDFLDLGESYDVKGQILFAFRGENSDSDSSEGAGKPDTTEKQVSNTYTMSFSEDVLNINRAEPEKNKSLLGISAALCDGKAVYEGCYDSSQYSEYTVNCLMHLLDHVAGEMLCKEKLSDITLVTEKDKDTIASLYDSLYPVVERPAYRLLQDTAEKYPERVAMVAIDRSLTYKELNGEANALGHYLQNLGAKPDTIIAVLAERNSYAYVMRQGALKSGGAFMPIDPEYPEDRIGYILEDSKAKLLVTTGEVLDKRKELFDKLAASGITVINVYDAVKEGDRSDINVSVSPESLAYVIYTSGSTGKPKGVMLMNKNIVNFVDDNEKNHETIGYTRRGHVSLAIAALTFDVSIMEEFIPLANGLTSVLATREEIMNPQALAELMIKNGVDLMSCTPSYLMNLLDMGKLAEDFQKAIKNVKSIDLGAEAFPAALYDKLSAVNPDIHIMNGYGPTEATISCTMQVIRSSQDITIGIPNANVSICTMDRNQKLQPLGALGEMVIMGEGVGRGYIGRVDLNEKCFINVLGKRAYRSGDLVRIRKDGNIEFHGRMDNQVKLRGLRVELGEIESVINSYPKVRSSIVVVIKQKTDYLAAYFTADETVDIDSLRKHLASKLTEYMVPQVFIQLDQMPLTANGKIDKKALPEPGTDNEDNYEAPSTDMEKLLCEKYALCIGLEKVGVNDDFFEIGGSSITSIRLIVECNHPGVNNATIYKYRTPKALAAYCEGIADNDAIAKENEAAMKEALPLTPGMKLYLDMQLEAPDSVYCNDAMLYRLKEDIDLEAFTAALNKSLKQHPAFSTKMIRDAAAGEYRQVYDESIFKEVSVEEMTSSEFEDAKDKLVQPFKILDSPLWRSRVICTEKDSYLYIEVHHIISDGFSFRVLFDQIYECYSDAGAVLEPDYYYYLMKRANDSSAEEYKEAEEYSKTLYEKLGGLKESGLSLKPDHEADSLKGAVNMKPLPFDRTKVGSNVLFIAACALSVCRYNDTDRTLIRFVSEARNDIHKLNSFGPFAGFYPIVFVKEKDSTPESLMADVEEQVRFIDSHTAYPYFKDRFKDTNKLVRFIYQKDIDDIGSFAELIEEETELDTNNDEGTDSMFGISVVDISKMENLIFVERYSKAHYDQESVEKMYGYFCEA
ncbi:MAG: amino acid adenylation domain-containing protein, partial [Oribacterium sp.]|nr:amino acid adenylation domain-containing protein [Oribacterium sp.]